MPNILIIDNNIMQPHGCLDITRTLLENTKDGLDTTVCRGPEQQIPFSSKGFDGVIISGSKTTILDNAPWVGQLMDFIRKLHQEKIPALGICYGSQIIIKSLFGDNHVRRARTPEVGLVKIKLTDGGKKSPIFENLPHEFYSFCYHFDEIAKLPQEYAITALSQNCAIQGYDVPNTPIWGIQFHPEKNPKECAANVRSIKEEISGISIFNEDDLEKMFDRTVGDKIFTNFLKQV